MSSSTYVNEEGAGQKHSDLCHYSQAVIIGNVVKCSGQGGWTVSGALDASDRVLRAAELCGWEDFYLVRSYHVDMGASYDHFSRKFRNVCQDTGQFGPLSRFLD